MAIVAKTYHRRADDILAFKWEMQPLDELPAWLRVHDLVHNHTQKTLEIDAGCCTLVARHGDMIALHASNNDVSVYAPDTFDIFFVETA